MLRTPAPFIGALGVSLETGRALFSSGRKLSVACTSVSNAQSRACWSRARRLRRRVAHVRRWVIREKLLWGGQAREYTRARSHGAGTVQLQMPYSYGGEAQGLCLASVKPDKGMEPSLSSLRLALE